jgi:hypothetical protein
VDLQDSPLRGIWRGADCGPVVAGAALANSRPQDSSAASAAVTLSSGRRQALLGLKRPLF